MMNFVRSVCMTISAACLMAIPTLYSLFHGLAAEPEIFDTSEIRRLTTNIYTLVSVIMLFSIATRSIAAIVNPDNIWESKKGITSVIKRAIVALILLVAVPFGFQYFYKFQTQVINNYIIEKLILGIDYSGEVLTEEQEEELEKYIEQGNGKGLLGNSLEKMYKRGNAAYKIGNVMSQKILAATLHPAVTDSTGEKCVSRGVGVAIVNPVAHPIRSFGGLSNVIKIDNASNICDNYNKAISSDSIDYVAFLVPQINAVVGITTEVDATGVGTSVTNALGLSHYVLDFDYWGLLCLIASVAATYMLILFCIDSAVRLIKMAFLEITAPVSIMAFIFGGTDILKKWFNELLSTAISFFLRVAAISFIALVLINLDTFTDKLPNYYSNLAKVFIIIGSLIFAKKVPELIEKVSGIKLDLGGGIGGRLGNMIGVGNIAKGAWDSLGKFAKKTAITGATLPLVGAGAGLFVGAKAIDKHAFEGKGAEFINKLKEGKVGAGASAIGSFAKSGGGIKGAKAALDSYNKNPSVMASKYEREELEKKERKNKIMEQISQNTNGKLIVDDGNGNYVFDASRVSSDKTEALTDSNNIIESRRDKISSKQLENIKDANEKGLKYSEAHDNSARLSSTIKYLTNLKTTTTSPEAKARIAQLITNLEQGNVVNASAFEIEMKEIQKLASISKFNDSALASIRTNISAGTVDGYNNAINELTAQLGNVRNKTSLNTAISDLKITRDAAIATDLQTVMTQVSADINTKTADGYDRAISQLRQQLSVVSDSTIKGDIQTIITELENTKPSASGIVMPISTVITGKISDINSSASAIISSASSIDLSRDMVEVTRTQEAEKVKLVSNENIRTYKDSLDIIAKSRSNGELAGTTQLEYEEEDAKDKFDKAEKDVEKSLENATSEQKENAGIIKKQSEDIRRAWVRKRK